MAREIAAGNSRLLDDIIYTLRVHGNEIPNKCRKLVIAWEVDGVITLDIEAYAESDSERSVE